MIPWDVKLQLPGVANRVMLHSLLSAMSNSICFPSYIDSYLTTFSNTKSHILKHYDSSGVMNLQGNIICHPKICFFGIRDILGWLFLRNRRMRILFFSFLTPPFYFLKELKDRAYYHMEVKVLCVPFFLYGKASICLPNIYLSTCLVHLISFMSHINSVMYLLLFSSTLHT